MRVIIADREVTGRGEDMVIRPKEGDRGCCGCFSCWLRTPGECAQRDGLRYMGRTLAQCDELVVVSRCVFGGYSPAVKKVLDRSIAYVKPFFEMRQGMMHHRRRYANSIRMSVLFYGDCGEEERCTAKKLVQANAVNLFASVRKVSFLREGELEGVRL